MSILKNKFAEVFFIPGNHELWVRHDEPSANSIVKLFEVLKVCKQMGVHTDPKKVKCKTGKDVWIVPLFSW